MDVMQLDDCNEEIWVNAWAKHDFGETYTHTHNWNGLLLPCKMDTEKCKKKNENKEEKKS